MSDTPTRPFRARLKSLAIFVALVWSVAASFIAFERLSLWGMDVAVAHPGVVGDIAVSHAASTSTVCNVAPGDASAQPSGISPAQARTLAWMLGLRFGQETRARQSVTVTPEVIAGARTAVEQVATLLAVPVPDAFTPENLGAANIEFVNAMEADARTTAHTLAVRYSPAACGLYKLGAVWGQVMFGRTILPGERPALSSELRYYAQQVALPEALWRAMADPPAATATGQDIFAESQTLTQGVTAYLSKE